MTLSDDERKRTPPDRFRNILSADKADGTGSEPRKPPVVNLPRIGEPTESGDDRTASRSSPDPKAKPVISRLLAGFWTVGSVLSFVANVVLVLVLAMIWRGVGAPAAAEGGGGSLAALYGGLEQMDQAHIRATIPVQTTVALEAPIPIQTSTNITLARDVAVDGAHVKISTGLIDIDAPASVTLPAGTALEVALDMIVPFQTSVPIAVEVPIDIAISDTDLHAAIISLENAIRPALCAATPNALRLDGTPVCR